MNIKHVNRLARALDGLPLLGCVPGSPSHRAGLRAGDVILSVGGHRVRTLDDYARVTRDTPGSREVVVFRDGEELRFTLELRGYRARVQDVHAFVEREGLTQLQGGFAGAASTNDTPN